MNLAIIPARSGSKRIVNKNIKFFLKKPIISYSITEAKKSKLFKEVIVSTDSNKIKNVANKFGSKVYYLRSNKLSNDHCPIEDVLIELDEDGISDNTEIEEDIRIACRKLLNEIFGFKPKVSVHLFRI